MKAVDDISFEIMRGSTFGVVGESGCGKSTLGRTLIRLKPTDGHIYLEGQDIAALKGAELKKMRKKAQIIFQDPSACLNPRRTVKQILMEPFGNPSDGQSDGCGSPHYGTASAGRAGFLSFEPLSA